jgi:general stress protein 26
MRWFHIFAGVEFFYASDRERLNKNMIADNWHHFVTLEEKPFMGDIKNLHDQEAITKIKEIGESVKTCMFCTGMDEIPFSTRPMATQEVDEQGCLWFFSDKQSHKNEDIKSDSKVQLIYADPGNTKFLSVYGTATVFYDKTKVEELWNPFIKTWFQEGKDDPNLSLIKVQSHEAYYWNTKDGRIVTLLKIAAGALSGKEMDGSVEGKLNV